jgi:HK97 family phage prohead protease
MPVITQPGAGKAPGSTIFVLSDERLNRRGDIVDTAGWQLDEFRQNPIALFNHDPDRIVGNWANVRVENRELLGEFQPVAPGTSTLGDEVRLLVEQDILRAASVGFRYLKSEPLDPEKPLRGRRYTKQVLMEVSLVSVPANPGALSKARSLHLSDDVMELVFGKHAAIETNAISPGKHAATHPKLKARVMNISQQIEDVQTRLNNARDALLEHTAEPDHDAEEADRINGEIEYLEKDLASKQRTEKSLAVRAINEPRDPQAQALAVRRPLGVSVPATAKSDYLWRAAAAGYVAKVRHQSVDDVLRERYAVERYSDAEATKWVTHAAVSGALTSVPAWAGDLVQQGNAEWLANLTPPPVFSRLSALGTAMTFGPNQGSIKIPSRATTPSITGSFVAEANPIPVRRLGVTSITLIPHKMGVISVYSREMAAYSNPSIESIIRQGIEDDTSITIDTLLLDATAESATRPAGLRYGISSAGTASTVKGYAAILADLALLTAPFFNVNAGRTLALIMNPQQAMQLGFAPGPDGTFGWAAAFTNRFTIIESTTVTAGTVIMVDAADFVSVNGAPEFDISEQATLHLDDTTPLNIGVAGAPATVAAPTQSMYQTAQIAIRMLLNVTWAMRRTGMVQYLTGVNWSPA